MNSRSFITPLALAALLMAALPAAAQDLTADVKTWSGQALHLAQPSLEVFYTILPKDEGPLPAGGQAPGGMGSGQSSGSLIGTEVRGSVQNLTRLFGGGGPEPLRGNRQAQAVSITQDGVERQIPVDTIKDLAFKREQITNSTLPPYLASGHFRYAASVVLTDGSRVDGDYINLGTTVLRGQTPEGRVDIPWQEIESVRFTR